ncbi:hypothetical protein Nizo1840_2396 [Lactiplantibacillus plantarum]|nr:hypothetical protein Nizo1840_2396 [Lactiplantibacillus plantarum]KZU11841.1 hypothetical protein Nizo2264_2419 [Lactiplantibacillus plantarum]
MGNLSTVTVLKWRCFCVAVRPGTVQGSLTIAIKKSTKLV